MNYSLAKGGWCLWGAVVQCQAATGCACPELLCAGPAGYCRGALALLNHPYQQGGFCQLPRSHSSTQGLLLLG